jgi:hypothetical protein
MRPSPIFAALAILSLPVSALAANQGAPADMPARGSSSTDFAKFTPAPSRNLKIDYAYLDEILNNLVFLTGVSTRQIAPRPYALPGTRFIAEHKSPLRLEGNKIPFSRLKAEHIDTLREYQRELQKVGTDVNIASLSRKEQLAYWYNLHNVTAIMLIAENYPVLQPKNIAIGPGKVPFHDAKVMNVGGVQMSLRDIRENIVFPNWQDANVIYGFFLGDIGSPSLQGRAFNAQNVDQLLDQNADEFVNSLRGFGRGGVSKIYKDVARFYFPNFDTDIRAHFQQHMWDEVYDEMAAIPSLAVNSYEYDIADMEGGHGGLAIGNVTVNGRVAGDSKSYAIASYTNQIKEKSEVLLRQGRIKRGVVTVGDEEPEDVAKPADQPE